VTALPKTAQQQATSDCSSTLTYGWAGDFQMAFIVLPFVCFHQYPIKMEHISGKPLGVSLGIAGRPTADVWVDSLLAWLVISFVCTWRFNHWRMVSVIAVDTPGTFTKR